MNKDRLAAFTDAILWRRRLKQAGKPFLPSLLFSTLDRLGDTSQVFQRALSYLFITFSILISFLHVSLSQEAGSSSKAGIMARTCVVEWWMDG